MTTVLVLCLVAMVTGLGSRHAGANGNGPTAAERQTMAQADNSAGGQTLHQNGYHSQNMLADPDLVKFLNDKLPSAGTYVVFSAGQSKTIRPTNRPDGVVDTNTGTIVAFVQSFTDERGTLCFNAATWVFPKWVAINQALRGKSLDQAITLNHQLLSAIPRGQQVACYVFRP